MVCRLNLFFFRPAKIVLWQKKEFIGTKILHHKPSPLRMKIIHSFLFVIHYHFKALLIIELRLLTTKHKCIGKTAKYKCIMIWDSGLELFTIPGFYFFAYIFFLWSCFNEGWENTSVAV